MIAIILWNERRAVGGEGAEIAVVDTSDVELIADALRDVHR
jgi:hypothetical protein